MNEKLRSVNTRFWDDPFIEELSPSEKLLFLYLLTNPQTTLLGIYEITIKRICYDTGLNKDTVLKGLESFGKDKKAFYTKDSFIILPNWLKNQHLNTNMKIAVAKEFELLPNNIRDSVLTNGSERLGNDSEGFRMIMEALGKYKIEIESKEEDEIEGKKRDFDFSFISDNWKELFDKWISYKKSKNEMYKTQESLEACYRNLLRLSESNIEKGRLILDNSIGNNYSGLFPLKNEGTKNFSSEPKRSTKYIRDGDI